MAKQGYDMTKQITADNSKFLFAVTPSLTASAEEGKQRTFSGVAYGGGKIEGHWYWGDVVFDISKITMSAERVAALIDHDRAQRCGYTTGYSTADNQFSVSGVLLDNEFGNAVASESDQGFPWQMSVHLDPSRVEVIESGSVQVNGQTFSAPITIFRDSKLHEVTFTATGWDSTTTAKAFSKGDNQEGDPMDLQQAQARITELEGQLTAVTAERDKFSRAARTEQIKNLFSAIGREYKDDDADVLAFAALPDVGFAATDKVLREQFSKQPQPTKPTVPAHLFSHQANGGAEPVAGLDGAFAKMINGMKEGK